MTSPHARYSGRQLQKGQGWCSRCEHILHPSKSAARRTIREMRSEKLPGVVLRAFPCPHGQGFHVRQARHVEQAVMDEAAGVTDPPRRVWDRS